MVMKNNVKKLGKKVLKHLKEDTSEFREQISDDTKLSKKIKKTISPRGKK